MPAHLESKFAANGAMSTNFRLLPFLLVTVAWHQLADAERLRNLTLYIALFSQAAGEISNIWNSGGLQE
jgi:hypothetical protein